MEYPIAAAFCCASSAIQPGIEIASFAYRSSGFFGDMRGFLVFPACFVGVRFCFMGGWWAFLLPRGPACGNAMARPRGGNLLAMYGTFAIRWPDARGIHGLDTEKNSGRTL